MRLRNRDLDTRPARCARGRYSITDATRDDREAGVTLIELIVYISLAGVLAIIAGSIFVTTVRSERHVVSSSHATASAQGVAQGIERSVRNAFRTTLASCASANTDCTELRVWTTLGGAQTCQAWRLNGTPAVIQHAEGSTMGSYAAFGTGIPGATLSFTGAQRAGAPGTVFDGVTYVVTIPYGDTGSRTARITGTVTSRTIRSTTVGTTCGTTA